MLELNHTPSLCARNATKQHADLLGKSREGMLSDFVLWNAGHNIEQRMDLQRETSINHGRAERLGWDDIVNMWGYTLPTIQAFPKRDTCLNIVLSWKILLVDYYDKMKRYITSMEYKMTTGSRTYNFDMAGTELDRLMSASIAAHTMSDLYL